MEIIAVFWLFIVSFSFVLPPVSALYVRKVLPGELTIQSSNAASEENSQELSNNASKSERSFIIANDSFIKDGVPVRIISGSIHYFRVLPDYWEDRMLRMKSLGVNAIQFYVPWNFHELRRGQYNFEGWADVGKFITTAQKLDLMVLLRLGPYTCGEWDLGGLPPWLLTVKPKLQFRTSDPAWLKLVDEWWDVLLPRMRPLLYRNGGPVVMVQVENEYGSYGADMVYLQHLVDFIHLKFGDECPIIYTTDAAGDYALKGGTINGSAVYSGVDFSLDANVSLAFEVQKRYNAPGQSPPMTMEFYSGWLTHWGEKMPDDSGKREKKQLKEILSLNGSVNFYMMYGGTNFGFWAGANYLYNSTEFEPDITSYDYAAPISEGGDTDNPKYKVLRQVLQEFLPFDLPEAPPLPKRVAYGEVPLTESVDVLQSVLTLTPSNVQESGGVFSLWPLTLEQLNQTSGHLLYASELPAGVLPGSTLTVIQAHDRAHVFVRNRSDSSSVALVGVLERWARHSVTLDTETAIPGGELLILVEAMGRINYGTYLFDPKGITESVTLDGLPLLGWKMFPIPLDDQAAIAAALDASLPDRSSSSSSRGGAAQFCVEGSRANSTPSVFFPTLFRGSLNISEPADTFLSLIGWTKGIAFINGFNLGRYWPVKGPQCHLYVPAPLLHVGLNEVVLLELDSAPSPPVVNFTAGANFSCTPVPLFPSQVTLQGSSSKWTTAAAVGREATAETL